MITIVNKRNIQFTVSLYIVNAGGAKRKAQSKNKKGNKTKQNETKQSKTKPNSEKTHKGLVQLLCEAGKLRVNTDMLNDKSNRHRQRRTWADLSDTNYYTRVEKREARELKLIMVMMRSQ